MSITQLRQLATQLISYNTEKGIRINQKAYKTSDQLRDPESELSEKATEIKKVLTENEFGCAKQSVARLVSAMIDEKIEIAEDCDDGIDYFKTPIIVPMFSLVKAKCDFCDYEDENIEEGDFMLRVDSDSSDNWTEVPDVNNTKFNLINNKGALLRSIEKAYAEALDFALENEINNFVKNIPAEALKVWFEPFMAFVE
jgi:hypothetical protein